ncbi:MAG: glucose-6-phosphate dehydrogenase [Candidatus Dependentiae bacterium]|nr:glucose-6-phosphate dehydrogenase [Candidatus Dependentiae bacterium]
MNDCTIILLGASGDLSKRKIIPALYHLIERGILKKFVVVGAAREQISAQQILQRSQEFIGPINAGTWQTLQESFFYHTLDFTKQDDYHTLHGRVQEYEKKYNLSGNRIIYIATASQFFCTITRSLAASKLALRLNTDEKIWHRMVYEKPFGSDLASAQAINKCIQESFFEHQIYRVDHFLSKELVSNIALLRFTNIFFEPLWNNRYIENVQIILDESIGLEGRGAYYDKYGALSDVVQNHILEMLALIAMESPATLQADDLRNARAQLLTHVEFVDGILGQYEGYTQEPNVAPDSKTETFAAVILNINNDRWRSVPFYLRTGKKLYGKKTGIYITFKKVACLLAKQCPTKPNSLTIQIDPAPFFAIQVNAKKMGSFSEVNPINMEFCHNNIIPLAYETLLEAIYKADQAVAVRFDEIESAWKITDTIKAAHLKVYPYKQGEAGPAELEVLNNTYGIGDVHETRNHRTGKNGKCNCSTSN